MEGTDIDHKDLIRLSRIEELGTQHNFVWNDME